VGENAYRAVKWALEVRVAPADAGAALKRSFGHAGRISSNRQLPLLLPESGVPRADIFLTTKLKHNVGFDPTIKAIDRFLELCGLDYIDLYLSYSWALGWTRCPSAGLGSSCGSPEGCKSEKHWD